MAERPRRADDGWYNNGRYNNSWYNIARGLGRAGYLRDRDRWHLHLVQPPVMSHGRGAIHPGTSVRCDGDQGPVMTVKGGPQWARQGS